MRHALICFGLWIWRWRPVIDADHHSTVWPAGWVSRFRLRGLRRRKTGKDITGTEVKSQNKGTEAAGDDVPPVQIEHRFNKLSTLIVHSVTTVPFFLSFCMHLCILNIKVLTIWREVVRFSVAHFKVFLLTSVLKI